MATVQMIFIIKTKYEIEKVKYSNIYLIKYFKTKIMKIKLIF